MKRRFDCRFRFLLSPAQPRCRRRD